jgi:hypothetical protein
MTLPTNGRPWPLPSVAAWYAQAEINSAWYEGDIAELTRIYGSGSTEATVGAQWRNGSLMTGGLVGGVKAVASKWFNGQPVTTDVTRLHSPLAGNLAALSSALLFGEPPTIRLIDMTETDGRKVRRILDEKAQNRVDAIFGSDLAHIAMSRVGEYAAGVGAGAFSLAWDPEEAEVWIQAHAGDSVIPEFRNGRLKALGTFDVYPGRNSKIIRHLISHDPGTISHGVYLGTVEKLGDILPPTSRDWPEELAYLRTIQNSTVGPGGEIIVPTGTQWLTASFMPNATVRRGRRDSTLINMGRSDYEGIEQFLDTHDETWSSAIRDLRLGRGRLLVPDAFLEGKGAGNGVYFDSYAEIMTGIASPGAGSDKLADSIHNVQFEIRWEAHIGLLYAEVAEVLQHAGYSRSSYGDEGSTEETAAGVVDGAKRSERTRDLKARYARMALASLVRPALDIDRILYRGFDVAVEAENVEVAFPDVSQIDPEKQARTLSFLRAADAISIWQSVRERNPNWDETEVDREVERITEERQTEADPFGVGTSDPNPDDLANGSGQNDAGQFDEATQREPESA